MAINVPLSRFFRVRMCLIHIIRRCALVACAVCVAAFGAAAQDGSSAYSFLNVTSSSKIYGLGGVNVSLVDDDLMSTDQNPALLGPEMSNQIGINYMHYIGGSNFAGIRYAHSAGEHGAWSAAVNYFGVQMTQGDDAFIEMRGGIAFYPYDSLSEEIRELAEDPVIQKVSSWQAAEDLIGIDLVNNPVLDGASTHGYFQIRDGVEGRFFVQPSQYIISSYGSFQIGDVCIDLNCQIFTENKAPYMEEDDTFYGIKFADSAEITQDVYTAPSGLTAQIVQAYSPESRFRPYCCCAVSSLNGIPTIVTAYSATGMEEARAVLNQVLDGFILSE